MTSLKIYPVQDRSAWSLAPQAMNTTGSPTATTMGLISVLVFVVAVDILGQ